MQPNDMKAILDRAFTAPAGVAVATESRPEAEALRRRFYKLISTEKRKLSKMTGTDTHPWPGLSFAIVGTEVFITRGASDPTRVRELPAPEPVEPG